MGNILYVMKEGVWVDIIMEITDTLKKHKSEI